MQIVNTEQEELTCRHPVFRLNPQSYGFDFEDQNKVPRMRVWYEPTSSWKAKMGQVGQSSTELSELLATGTMLLCC